MLSKAQALLVLYSYEFLSTLYVTYRSTYFIYILLIKFNFDLKEFQVSNNYSKSYQENKMEFFDELYFYLNLHNNLNIKSMNVNEFFSTS